ncbi:adenosine monophosphate-protein transferase [Synergistales bacterium]|nr:adenosine monophosphate-protein transferase [Synergistales bacterium]
MPELKFVLETVEIPEGCNVIVGQSHFIKTVEDLFEALVTSSPSLLFGIAFCEASIEKLVRKDGNDDELIELAVKNALKIAAGHCFVIVIRNGYPINIMSRVKAVQEVCAIYAATANPLQIVLAESEQGRGIIGVIDGGSPIGVEDEKGVEWRKNLLRNVIGYKR